MTKILQNMNMILMLWQHYKRNLLVIVNIVDIDDKNKKFIKYLEVIIMIFKGKVRNIKKF